MNCLFFYTRHRVVGVLRFLSTLIDDEFPLYEIYCIPAITEQCFIVFCCPALEGAE